MLLHIRMDYQGPGKLKNIGWAKPLIFFELLGISNFLGSIIDVFILFVWILGGQMTTLPTHFPDPDNGLLGCWVSNSGIQS